MDCLYIGCVLVGVDPCYDPCDDLCRRKVKTAYSIEKLACTQKRRLRDSHEQSKGDCGCVVCGWWQRCLGCDRVMRCTAREARRTELRDTP